MFRLIALIQLTLLRCPAGREGGWEREEATAGGGGPIHLPAVVWTANPSQTMAGRDREGVNVYCTCVMDG